MCVGETTNEDCRSKVYGSVLTFSHRDVVVVVVLPPYACLQARACGAHGTLSHHDNHMHVRLQTRTSGGNFLNVGFGE